MPAVFNSSRVHSVGNAGVPPPFPSNELISFSECIFLTLRGHSEQTLTASFSPLGRGRFGNDHAPRRDRAGPQLLYTEPPPLKLQKPKTVIARRIIKKNSPATNLTCKWNNSSGFCIVSCSPYPELPLNSVFFFSLNLHLFKTQD